jgi:putative nucleotidyltransferase with HDIG domain
MLSARRSTLTAMAWHSTDARRLAAEMLSGAGCDRWLHVQMVARTVEDLAGEAHVPGDVLAAAWLHDIGYAPELVMTGMHAVDGAAFLDRAGAPNAVVSLVAFHTGAEFEADERGLVDALAQFDRPDQKELDLLILADLVSSPTGERVTVRDRLDEILNRYEPQHPVHRAVTRSRSYLQECAARASSRVGYPM